MSSKKQRQLRVQERTKRKEDAKRKQRDRCATEASIFRDNEECERLIKNNMLNGKEPGYIPLLKNATIINFGSKETKGVTPSKNMLIAYVQVRSDRSRLKNGNVVYRSKLRSRRRPELVDLCVKLTAIAIMKPLLQRLIETVVEVHDDVLEETVEEVIDEMLGGAGVLM
jgi:hypothetical protein